MKKVEENLLTASRNLGTKRNSKNFHDVRAQLDDHLPSTGSHLIDLCTSGLFNEEKSVIVV